MITCPIVTKTDWIVWPLPNRMSRCRNLQRLRSTARPRAGNGDLGSVDSARAVGRIRPDKSASIL